MTRMFPKKTSSYWGTPMTMETSYISYYRFYSSSYISIRDPNGYPNICHMNHICSIEFPPGLQAVLQALRAPTRPARCRRIQGIWWIWRRSQPRSEIMEVTPVLKSFKNGWLLQIGKWVMWYTKKKYKYYIYIYIQYYMCIYIYIYMGYRSQFIQWGSHWGGLVDFLTNHFEDF